MDTTIFDKQPKFFGVFLVTSLIGTLLISVAVYRASKELEVIHEIDNLNRIIGNLLVQKAAGQKTRNQRQSNRYSTVLTSTDSPYLLYFLRHGKANPIRPQQSVLPLPTDTLLEDTRVNERGGYFNNRDTVYTWTTLNTGEHDNQLLVVNRFRSTGNGVLKHVYRQRMIIPVFFYLWLLIWVYLFLDHLLYKLCCQQEKMKQMALHDALTGLPNRNLMEDRLLKTMQLSQRDNKQFAYSVIDLDGFKDINDRYGHDYGDTLLQEAAKRLQTVLRDSDTAARDGGDEFIVLLSDIDEQAWHSAFVRILTALTEPYVLFEHQVMISASIGVALYPRHSDTADQLLRQADQAMYVAKAAGGGIHLHELNSNLMRTGHDNHDVV